MKDKKKLTTKIVLIKTIRIIIISYITILVFLFFKQKDMVYYPDYPESSSFYDCNNFTEDEKKEYNWTRFYEKKWTNDNLVIFFHWNAWSACSRVEMKNILEKTWNNFIFVEYYWYSNPDNNNPNIEKILQDSLNIWEYIKNSEYKNINVIWRSVWTWPASYYAQNFEIKKLLLITPYSQLYKVASNKYPIFPIKALFSENYNSEEYLKDYKWELLIIHWNNDKVVPFHLAKELYNWINTTNKEFFEINNWNHNDILYYEWVSEKIIKFLD